MGPYMRHAIGLAFLLTLAIPASGIAAETACSPAEFMAKDPESIVLSDHTRIAFTRTATKEQYEQAKAALGDRLNVGLLDEPLDYDQAREVTKAEAQALKFDFDAPYFNSYLAQRIYNEAKAMYVACLRSQNTGEGLRLWLDRREGDYYFLTGFWISADPKAKGLLNKQEIFEDNVGIVSIPDVWPAKVEKTVVVKAGKTDGGMISVTVGTHSKSFVVFPDPPRTGMLNVESPGPEMVARSGGGISCERHTQEQCLTPLNPAGYFVPNTVRFDGTRAPDTGFEVTKDTTSQICVRVWALSPVCQTEVRIDGRPVVVERYPGP